MNNKLVLISVLFFFVAGGYYLIIQEHKLEDSVFHYSSEFGNLDFPFAYETIMTSKGNLTNDYSMFVNYESTGAFMAGREITVSVDFMAVNKIEKLRNSHLWVVFPGSFKKRSNNK